MTWSVRLLFTMSETALSLIPATPLLLLLSDWLPPAHRAHVAGGPAGVRSGHAFRQLRLSGASRLRLWGGRRGFGSAKATVRGGPPSGQRGYAHRCGCGACVCERKVVVRRGAQDV